MLSVRQAIFHIASVEPVVSRLQKLVEFKSGIRILSINKKRLDFGVYPFNKILYLELTTFPREFFILSRDYCQNCDNNG